MITVTTQSPVAGKKKSINVNMHSIHVVINAGSWTVWCRFSPLFYSSACTSSIISPCNHVVVVETAPPALMDSTLWDCVEHISPHDCVCRN